MFSYVFKKVLNLVPRPLLIRLSYGVRPVLAFVLRGNRFFDPIDGKGYRLFLPYGYANQRAHVLAPGTLSLERHRLLWLYLQRETGFFTKVASQKLLHFAPEQAFYKRFKHQKNLQYLTTDLHSPLADVKADICNLPFDDDCFDIIFCNHVLEHIPDDIKAMTELYRILKPGGWAIIQVPLDPNRQNTFEDDSITDKTERTRIFGQYDHVRVYGMDYFNRLASVGFQVAALDFTAHFSEMEIQKYGLAKGELLPLCRKV